MRKSRPSTAPVTGAGKQRTLDSFFVRPSSSSSSSSSAVASANAALRAVASTSVPKAKQEPLARPPLQPLGPVPEASWLSLPVALKGRQHHPQGSVSQRPFSVLVETENLNDVNALAVIDASKEKIGYVDRQSASVLSPLVRSGLIRIDGVEISEALSMDVELARNLALVLQLRITSHGKSVFDGSARVAPPPSIGGGFVKASQVVSVASAEDVAKAAELTRLLNERNADVVGYFQSNVAPAKARKPKQPNATSTIAAHLVRMPSSPAITISSTNGTFDFVLLPETILNRICCDYGLTSAEVFLGLSLASRGTAAALETVKACFKHRRRFTLAMTKSAQSTEVYHSEEVDHQETHLLLSFAQLKPKERAIALHGFLCDSPYTSYALKEEIFCEALLVLSARPGRAGQAIVDHFLQLHANIRASQLRGLTSEQLAVARFDCQPGRLLKVRAFAGSGKTRCLLELAKHWPMTPMLYVCFNRSVKKHAERIFPANVTCLTLHGLAHERLGRPVVATEFDYTSVCNLLSCSLAEANKTLAVLSAFLNSAQQSVQDPSAQAVWDAMLQGRIPMTLQSMLKRFALSRPVLSEFRVILLDEAQDSNPCAMDIVQCQAAHAAIVIVGDSHQSIYGWNAAKDALDVEARADQVVATTVFLTRSFRFGPLLGMLATRLVQCRGEKKLVLGCSRECATSGDYEALGRRGGPSETLSGFVRRVKGSVLVLARTNVGLVQAMISASQSGLRVAALDGVKKRVKDLERIADEALKSGKLSGSPSDEGMARLVELWGAEGTKAKIATLLQSAVRADDKDVDVMCSTVHGAKGLEYDGVWLEDDFPIVVAPNTPLWKWLGVSYDESQHTANEEGEEDDRSSKSDQGGTDWNEEMNLLYVAVTRAKRALVLCATLEENVRAMRCLVPALC